MLRVLLSFRYSAVERGKKKGWLEEISSRNGSTGNNREFTCNLPGRAGSNIIPSLDTQMASPP